MLTIIETSRGHEVADATRYAAAMQNPFKRFNELRGGVDHLKSQQNMPMTAMERKNKLMTEASEEIPMPLRS